MVMMEPLGLMWTLSVGLALERARQQGPSSRLGAASRWLLSQAPDPVRPDDPVSAHSHRWLSRVLGDPWVQPPPHLDGDTEAPRGQGLTPSHTVSLVPSLVSAPPTGVIPTRSHLPPDPPHLPGSPSSSWCRVFHSRLMGAAPSWMRHLKLASWPCCTVLLGGSMEMTGLLSPGGPGG